MAVKIESKSNPNVICDPLDIKQETLRIVVKHTSGKILTREEIRKELKEMDDAKTRK